MHVTREGARVAQIAFRLYALGFSPDEVYDIVGLPEMNNPESTKEGVMAELMLAARRDGVLDTVSVPSFQGGRQ